MINDNDNPKNEKFDNSQARNEGWVIEYNNQSGSRIRGISYSDMQAWWHIAREVKRGSEYHQSALLEISDKERFAMEISCGPLSTPII
ncbi:MAG: hypothetical protein ABF689_14760 [Gluconobacter cerinus]|uniref:hypothetical protein n=1 Tax=Gluconobacter cerinus TaxID=38307 RepID=UPI0039ED43BB